MRMNEERIWTGDDGVWIRHKWSDEKGLNGEPRSASMQAMWPDGKVITDCVAYLKEGGRLANPTKDDDGSWVARR